MSTLVATMIVVDGIRSVQIRVLRHEWLTRVPVGVRVVLGVVAERIRAFAKAIDVWIAGQRGSKPQILRLKNECLAGGVEEDLAVGLAGDCKGEGFLLHRKGQVSRFRELPGLGHREQVIGDLIHAFIGIVYFDV